jgi:hypothetical protein
VTVPQGVKSLGGGLPLGQVVFAGWLILAGQVIAQVEELLTLTVKLQVATTTSDTFLPVQLTEVCPTGKLEPEGGLQVTVSGLGHGPTGVAAAYVTTAEPEPGELSLTVLSSGQSSAQAVLVIVTVKLQETVLFGLVAVQCTVVLPVENTEPEGGLQTTVTQLPVVVGAG